MNHLNNSTIDLEKSTEFDSLLCNPQILIWTFCHFLSNLFLFWIILMKTISQLILSVYCCTECWKIGLFPGGTFALYSLLCRNINIGILSSKRMESNSSLLSTNLFGESERQSRLGKFFERSLVSRRVLLFIAILGMCMLIGDGILTPAISGLFLCT